MTSSRLILYTAFDGAETRLTWKNEDNYQKVRKFLNESGLGVTPIRSGTATGDEFVYIETEQQYESFLDFVQTLNDKASSAPNGI